MSRWRCDRRFVGGLTAFCRADLCRILRWATRPRRVGGCCRIFAVPYLLRRLHMSMTVRSAMWLLWFRWRRLRLSSWLNARRRARLRWCGWGCRLLGLWRWGRDGRVWFRARNRNRCSASWLSRVLFAGIRFSGGRLGSCRRGARSRWLNRWGRGFRRDRCGTGLRLARLRSRCLLRSWWSSLRRRRRCCWGRSRSRRGTADGGLGRELSARLV